MLTDVSPKGGAMLTDPVLTDPVPGGNEGNGGNDAS